MDDLVSKVGSDKKGIAPPFAALYLIAQSVFITLKVDGTAAGTSWWLVLLPTWIYGFITIFYFIVMLYIIHRLIPTINEEYEKKKSNDIRNHNTLDDLIDKKFEEEDGKKKK